jgi:hypothetical protein
LLFVPFATCFERLNQQNSLLYNLVPLNVQLLSTIPGFSGELQSRS